MDNNQLIPNNLDEFIDKLFAVEIGDSLTILQNRFAQINNENPTESETFELIMLDSFWNFFQSQIAIQQNADFQQGLTLIDKAYQGFQRIGFNDFQLLIEGLKIYFSAILDIKTQNLTSGMQKLQSAKQHFNNIDKYGHYFAQQIDAMEAESYFVAGISHITQLDFENGQIDISKASSLSKKLAIKHFEKETPEYNLFMGYSYQYNAFGDLFIQFSKLNNYNFDFFTYHENEAYESSTKAIEFLSNSIGFSEIARINLQISKGINLLSEAVFNIGQWMNILLMEEKNTINSDIRVMKKSVSNAKRFFTEIGESGLIFIRICKQIDTQLSSIDKFIKRAKIEVVKPSNDVQLKKTVQDYIKKGLNEKAIDYLVANTKDYDVFGEILKLKSRQTRLLFEKINGTISTEEYRIEENALTDAILKVLDILEVV